MRRRGQDRSKICSSLAAILLVGLAGCAGGDKVTSATGASGSTSSGAATSSTATSEGTTGSGATTSASGSTGAPSTSGSTTDTSGSGGVDPCAPVETTGEIQSCNTFDQDCPPCQKCTAYANDGGSSWNDHRCVPIDPNPKQAFEPCTTQGRGITGFDDCDKGLMCLDADGDNVGYCIAYCIGSWDEPTCPVPAVCVIPIDEPIAFCIPTCDPLLQDCPGGDTCVPAYDDWLCLLPYPEPGLGNDGDPCYSPNACNPGVICINGDYLPDCQNDNCCASLCDLTQPNTCPLKDQGHECVPFYTLEEPPPGKENVGYCALP
ncbi:MAG: hypothetical protein H6710_17525 [Myxococcales bacterium]|nr:hypothetical protein [Myxococcales bacterium]